MVIVTSWSQNQRTFTANQLQWNLTIPVDFPNQIEIASKKIGSLWLLSKKVQPILPFFCAIPALVVFSWIVHLFDSRDVGSFNFSSANIPFLDTNQTVPSQVRKVYEVLWSDPWNWNCYCYCVFSVFLFFLRHEAIAKTAEFHTHRIYQNMLSAQIVTIKNNSWKYSFATLCSSWKHSLKLVIVNTIV